MSSDRPEGLRILICLLYYLPHRTGLTLYVQHLAESLAARGHRVTVLCARHSKDTPAGESIENGVRVIRLRPLPFAVSRGMVLPGYPWQLLRRMARHDVVSVHTPMLETALVALLARLSGRRVVATHHGDLVLPAGLGNRIITRLMFFFYRFLAKSAPALVCHTADYADHSYYLKPFRGKVVVIPPFVDVPVPNRARAEELRRQWSPDGAPLIGFAGRFVEEKRPDLLLQALEVVNATYPGARIVFAGQHQIRYEAYWPRHRELVERCKDQLVFLGVVPSFQDMADFYAALDVLALPSDTECFALVQVEAMLCGTPVVMTDTPGGRVPVRLTGMGRLVPRGDHVALGEALVEVIRNRERYVKPAAEIARHFSIEETVRCYEELFGRYAAAPARNPHPSVPSPSGRGEVTKGGSLPYLPPRPLGEEGRGGEGLGDDRPALGNGPPTLGGDSPTLGNDPPTLGNDSPALGGEPPTPGNDPPTLGNESPALGCDATALGNESPSLGNDPPALGNDSPALGCDATTHLA